MSSLGEMIRTHDQYFALKLKGEWGVSDFSCFSSLIPPTLSLPLLPCVQRQGAAFDTSSVKPRFSFLHCTRYNGD